MKFKKIGVIINEAHDFYQTKLLKGINKKATELGYDVLVFTNFIKATSLKNYEYGERNIFNIINFSKLDGVIVAGDTLQMKGLADEILSRIKNECTCPVVVVDYPTDEFDSVCVEDTAIFERVVDHIIDVHQCKKILFLSGSYQVTSTQHRLEGYKNSLNKHNIPFDEDFVCFDAGFTREGAAAVAEEIVSGKRKMPEAIICCGDQMAVSAMKVLENAGIKVPQDMIIVGYDATDEALQCVPALTSCSPPIFEAGENAVIDIDCRIRGINPSGLIHGGGKLEIGGSCGCPEDLSYTKRNYYRENSDDDYLEFLNSNMLEDFAEAENFTSLLYKIQYYLYLVKGWNNYYLCLCDYWLNNNMYRAESGYVTTEYTDVMTTYVKCENKYCRTVCENFNKEEILPEIYNNEKDKPTVYYFTPVHLNKKCFGYSVISFEDCQKVIDITYMNWCRHVSNALEFVRVQSEISSIAMRDVLTGVYSRFGLEKFILSNQADIYSGKNILVMLADVDKLKQINDEFGHSYGDLAIIAVAKALTIPLTSKEICARVGGDEFLIIGCDEYGENSLEKFIEQVQKNIKKINDSKEYPFEISASIGGVSKKVTDIHDFDKMYKQADKEMYKIKKAKHVERH